MDPVENEYRELKSPDGHLDAEISTHRIRQSVDLVETVWISTLGRHVYSLVQYTSRHQQGHVKLITPSISAMTWNEKQISYVDIINRKNRLVILSYWKDLIANVWDKNLMPNIWTELQRFRQTKTK